MYLFPVLPYPYSLCLMSNLCTIQFLCKGMPFMLEHTIGSMNRKAHLACCVKHTSHLKFAASNRREVTVYKAQRWPLTPQSPSTSEKILCIHFALYIIDKAIFPIIMFVLIHLNAIHIKWFPDAPITFLVHWLCHATEIQHGQEAIIAAWWLCLMIPHFSHSTVVSPSHHIFTHLSFRIHALFFTLFLPLIQKSCNSALRESFIRTTLPGSILNSWKH